MLWAFLFVRVRCLQNISQASANFCRKRYRSLFPERNRHDSRPHLTAGRLCGPTHDRRLRIPEHLDVHPKGKELGNPDLPLPGVHRTHGPHAPSFFHDRLRDSYGTRDSLP